MGLFGKVKRISGWHSVEPELSPPYPSTFKFKGGPLSIKLDSYGKSTLRLAKEDFTFRIAKTSDVVKYCYKSNGFRVIISDDSKVRIMLPITQANGLVLRNDGVQIVVNAALKKYMANFKLLISKDPKMSVEFNRPDFGMQIKYDTTTARLCYYSNILNYQIAGIAAIATAEMTPQLVSLSLGYSDSLSKAHLRVFSNESMDIVADLGFRLNQTNSARIACDLMACFTTLELSAIFSIDLFVSKYLTVRVSKQNPGTFFSTILKYPEVGKIKAVFSIPSEGGNQPLLRVSAKVFE